MATKTSTKTSLDKFKKYRVKRKDTKEKKARGFSVLVYGATGIGKTLGMVDMARELWELQQRDCIIISTEGQKTVNNVNQYCEVFTEFNPIVIELKAKDTIWGRVDHLRAIIDELNREIRRTPDAKFTIVLDSATDTWEDLLDWMTYSPEIQRQKITTTLPDGTKETSYGPMPTEWRKARKKFMDLLKDLTQSQNMLLLFSARPRLDRDLQVVGPLLDSKNFGEHFATVILEGTFKDKGKGRTWTLKKLDMLAKGKKGRLVGWAASKSKKVSGYLSWANVVKLSKAAMGIDLMKFLENTQNIPDSTLESETTENTSKKSAE
jgi:hypothetical protein